MADQHLQHSILGPHPPNYRWVSCTSTWFSWPFSACGRPAETVDEKASRQNSPKGARGVTDTPQGDGSPSGSHDNFTFTRLKLQLLRTSPNKHAITCFLNTVHPYHTNPSFHDERPPPPKTTGTPLTVMHTLISHLNITTTFQPSSASPRLHACMRL